jgi:bacterioferritin
MKGDARVIELLNVALKNELTAINQYWLHYRMLDHWGVQKLADFERHESIDEMKHADWLSERILFLKILANEEEHVDYLEKQFDLIKLMGIANYVQLQSKAANEESASTGD